MKTFFIALAVILIALFTTISCTDRDPILEPKVETVELENLRPRLQLEDGRKPKDTTDYSKRKDRHDWLEVNP